MTSVRSYHWYQPMQTVTIRITTCFFGNVPGWVQFPSDREWNYCKELGSTWSEDVFLSKSSFLKIWLFNSFFFHFKPFSTTILQVIQLRKWCPGFIPIYQTKNGVLSFFLHRCRNHSSQYLITTTIYDSIIQKIISLKIFKSSSLNDYRRVPWLKKRRGSGGIAFLHTHSLYVYSNFLIDQRRNIEILHIGIRKAAKQVCEVMLRDTTDSKRIDGYVQSQWAVSNCNCVSSFWLMLIRV